MILKLGRNILGQLIVFISFVTRPKAIKRTDEAQASIDEQAAMMSLYQFRACPFCTKTRRTLHRLSLNIELRDASDGSQYRQELEQQGGKIKVPCLRIEDSGETQWMYDSKAIVAYLDQRFAGA
jgi:glutaredoxin